MQCLSLVVRQGGDGLGGGGGIGGGERLPRTQLGSNAAPGCHRQVVESVIERHPLRRRRQRWHFSLAAVLWRLEEIGQAGELDVAGAVCIKRPAEHIRVLL